jgi:hypothetical protein
MAVAKYLGNSLDIVGAIRPVDLQDGANNGDWVSLKNCDRVIVVVHSAIGTAGDDPTLTLNQATDNAGTSSKVLTKIDTVYTKQAATSLLSTGAWTKETQTIASTYTEATSAEEEALWAVEIRAEDLDVDGGFDHLQAAVADVGSNAQLGAIYYILCGLKYPAAPESVISPL